MSREKRSLIETVIGGLSPIRNRWSAVCEETDSQGRRYSTKRPSERKKVTREAIAKTHRVMFISHGGRNYRVVPTRQGIKPQHARTALNRFARLRRHAKIAARRTGVVAKGIAPVLLLAAAMGSTGVYAFDSTPQTKLTPVVQAKWRMEKFLTAPLVQKETQHTAAQHTETQQYVKRCVNGQCVLVPRQQIQPSGGGFYGVPSQGVVISQGTPIRSSGGATSVPTSVPTQRRELTEIDRQMIVEEAAELITHHCKPCNCPPQVAVRTDKEILELIAAVIDAKDHSEPAADEPPTETQDTTAPEGAVFYRITPRRAIDYGRRTGTIHARDQQQ